VNKICLHVIDEGAKPWGGTWWIAGRAWTARTHGGGAGANSHARVHGPLGFFLPAHQSLRSSFANFFFLFFFFSFWKLRWNIFSFFLIE
jgi:hypothetical protein